MWLCIFYPQVLHPLRQGKSVYVHGVQYFSCSNICPAYNCMSMHKSMTLMHTACATPEPHLVRVLSLIDKGHTPHAMTVGSLTGESAPGRQCNISCMYYLHLH